MNLRSKMTASRTRVVTTSIALVAAAALTLTACSTGSSSEKTGSEGPVVKIGSVNQYGQGVNADAAEDGRIGEELGIKYVEEHGGLYNGGTFERVEATENGSPALVATSVRKLLTDGVKLIIGPSLTADCLGAAPLIDQAGAIGLNNCTTTSLTGPDRIPKNQYRWGTNDKMTSTALALKVAEKFKDADIVDYVAYDYLQGHEGVDTFKAVLKAKGVTPKTDHEFFVPASTTNYSSQIGALAQAPKDGKKRILVLLTWGAGYLNFIQQAAPLKVLDSYEGVFTTSMYYKSAVALKGAAPSVFNSYSTCYATIWKNDIMDWFIKEMKKKTSVLPSDWHVHGFNQVLIMAAAINKAKSVDSVKVDKAMSNLKVDTATGSMTMDPKTHQAIRLTPVCETVGDPKGIDGIKLVNSVIYPFKDLIG